MQQQLERDIIEVLKFAGGCSITEQPNDKGKQFLVFKQDLRRGLHYRWNDALEVHTPVYSVCGSSGVWINQKYLDIEKARRAEVAAAAAKAKEEKKAKKEGGYGSQACQEEEENREEATAARRGTPNQVRRPKLQCNLRETRPQEAEEVERVRALQCCVVLRRLCTVREAT